MAQHETLPPLNEQELMSPEPEVQARVSDEIDAFFNTKLDIFPYSDTNKKPERFHVFVGDQIAERFPHDQDLRDVISRFGRRFFGAMVGYMWLKRGLLLFGLAGISALLVWGVGLASNLGLSGVNAVGAVAGAMVLVYLVIVGVNAVIFSQYRFSLENRSYELSRMIIQRTRELQNLFLSIKALPDQEETRFPEAHAWGERSKYLTRLLTWVGSRMEYLERFLQMEMWRLRRERYWMSWAGGLGVLIIMGLWAWWLTSLTPSAGDTGYFRVLQAGAGLIGGILALSSYNFWKTPTNLARDKLGADGWVRYADLDVDDAIGDQVKRDKERIVEYRTLNKR